VDMDISIYIHGKSVDMDMDGKFHIHGKPSTGRLCSINAVPHARVRPIFPYFRK